MDLALHDIEAVERVERHLPGEGLKKNHAEAVPVARRGGNRSGDLFGRHVSRRADDGLAIEGIFKRDPHREAEVEQHHAPIARDHDIRRFDVPMDDAVSV